MELRRIQSSRIRNTLLLVLLSILLSVGLGAYWVSQVIDQLGTQARKETLALLTVEEAVNDAALIFMQQTQEWKDALLRAHDPEQFAEHHRMMQLDALRMQQVLQGAKAAMQAQGIQIADIISIEQKEQKLLADYAAALVQFARDDPRYSRLVDERVRGRDRELQAQLAQLRDSLHEAAAARVAVLGKDGREQAISSSFIQIGVLAVLLPLVSLFAFFRAYVAVREIGRSDARIRTIYESIGDAVLVADGAGRVDTLNDVAQKLTGWTQHQAQGRLINEVFALYDATTRQRVDSPAEIVLQTGERIPLSNGMILRRPDGSELSIEDSAAPVRDENGKLQAVVMVFHDVSQRYAMIARLKHEGTLFSQTFDQAGVGMAQLGLDGRWTRVNRKLCDISGYSESELLALSFQGMTHPDDLGQDFGALQALIEKQCNSYETEKRYIRKDGSIVWVSLNVSMVWQADGSPDYGISVIQDIQSRKDAEQDAKSSQAQYQALFEQMPEGVLLFDEFLQVIGHNREALRQLEYGSKELLNLHVWDVESIDDMARIDERKAAIAAAGRDDFESRYRTRSGRMMDVAVSVQLVPMANGRPVFQTLFRDITEQKQIVQQVEYLAYHDQLTGLANRRLLQDRIDQAVGSALRRSANIALCYLDLDHFKDVNDSLGHQAGDRLLEMVSVRLMACVRAEDTLARVGGDEFVIMLSDISDSEAAAAIAQKIISAISAPFILGTEEIKVTPSIGISICPQDGCDSDTLLKHADSAMYQAKQSGRATYHFYTEALHDKAMERLKMERLLRRAIENNEFEMYYQPQVDLKSRQIVGCEALIRWNHPGMGQVSPAQFIPVAEHSNLIVEIGAWVILNVCQQAKRWQDQGLGLKVSFNVSARQFIRPLELLQTLRSAVSSSGVDASMLELELTESLLLDPHGMSEVLGEIRHMGLSLALDDFGTGYSSLSYLRRFPIHILKIDRSFVSDSDSNANDAEMVRTIIGMAHNLSMSLVAEGVETAAQSALLAAEGCEVGQGYHYSRPLAVDQFEALLLQKTA